MLGLSQCTPSPDSPLKNSVPPTSPLTSPLHQPNNTVESPDLRSPTERPVSRPRNFSRKAPGRSLLSKDPKQRSLKTKKPKEAFEREALPSENSPKLGVKKDPQFSSLLDAKKGDKVLESTEELKNGEGESPMNRSSHNNSFIKGERLSPEIKDFTLSSGNKALIKKGPSLKNLELEGLKKEPNSAIKLEGNNRLSEGQSNNKAETNKGEDIITEPLKKRSQEMENAAKVIQRHCRKTLDRWEKNRRNSMLNPEIIEISRNRLHFPNPRRPCDYQIVICHDPNDVLNAILFIQAYFRKVIKYRKRLNKKDESLNEAQISVSCEESNLDSIKSVSFLDQGGNDDIGYKKGKSNDFIRELM